MSHNIVWCAMPKEMTDLIVEAFEQHNTTLLTWRELHYYCARHSFELRWPLHPSVDWRTLVYRLHQAISQLRQEGAITVTEHNGYINTIEKL